MPLTAVGQTTLIADPPPYYTVLGPTAVLSDGTVLVLDTYNSGFGAGVVARFTADGQELSNLQVQIDGASGYSGGIVALSNGGFAVVFQQDNGIGGHDDFYARAFNADGSPQGAVVHVGDGSGVASGVQAEGYLAPTRDGGYVLEYSDNTHSGTSFGTVGFGSQVNEDNDVYAVKILPDGSEPNGDPNLNAGTETAPGPAPYTYDGVAGDQRSGGPATLSNGTIVTPYFDTNFYTYVDGGAGNSVQKAGQYGISMRLFTASGESSEIKVDTLAPGDQYVTNSVAEAYRPVAAALDTGGFVVVWGEQQAHAPGDILFQARFFDATGHATSAVVTLEDLPTGGGAGHVGDGGPSVVGLPQGGFAIAYDTYGADVHLATFDDAGAQTGAVEVAGGGGDQHLTGLAAGPDGSIYVTWYDQNAAGSRESVERFVVADASHALTGTAGAETLAAPSGAAWIDAGAGDDTVVAGAGEDDISGGAGTDTLVLNEAYASATFTYADDGQMTVTGALGTEVVRGVEHLRFSDGVFDLGSDGRLEVGSTVAGTAAADTLVGGALDDLLQGGAGDDVLTGGGGSDRLDGGDGVDTATYAGFAHDYALALNAGDGTVTGGREGGTDTLASVETVQFLDGTLTFDLHSTAAQIVRLYDSFLGRAPDAAGFESYLRYVAAGHSFQDMADNAAASPEFDQATAGLNDTQYVTYVYEHSLHREPDPGGLQTYVADLENGTFTRTSMIVQAAESPEHVALTAGVVGQGLWVPDEKVEGLELLYDAAVQRQPDPTGIAGYSAELTRGSTFHDIANQMAASAEFQAAHGAQTDAEYIDSLYVAEVGRHADPSGLAAYEDQLAHGYSRGDILFETAMSQEHQSHVLAFYDPLLGT